MKRSDTLFRAGLRVIAVILLLAFGLGLWAFRHMRESVSMTPCARALVLGSVDSCTEAGSFEWPDMAQRQVNSQDGTLAIHYESNRSTYRLTCNDGRIVDLFTAWEYPACDEGDACVFWAHNSATIDLQSALVTFREARLRRMCGQDAAAIRD
jgi:hypothetical protein